MKLWQKVSLTALVFVMLAIQLTQFLVLERSFENSIQRERQTAVSAHEALSASLSNHAAYERLKAGKLLLSTDEIAELLSSTVTADISTASAIAAPSPRPAPGFSKRGRASSKSLRRATPSTRAAA